MVVRSTESGFSSTAPGWQVMVARNIVIDSDARHDRIYTFSHEIWSYLTGLCACI